MGQKDLNPPRIYVARIKASNTISLEAEKLQREMGLSPVAAMRLARELNPSEVMDLSRF